MNAAMAREGSPSVIYRKDYQAPRFQVPTVAMTIAIFPGYTRVSSQLQLQRSDGSVGDLCLDGESLQLEAIAIDGVDLSPDAYDYNGSQLTLKQVPASCTLQTTVIIHPEDNTSLEGLYKSRTLYCTQCEAEGFRKITFFPDRPDVLSVFTVTLEADASTCPVLLSNGNLQSTTTLDDGRHQAVWHDPWPKPSYLFALVAGDLARVDDSFVTASGREVALHIYVEAKDLAYCDHAMASLKHSMRWDETVYGLEYDLDLFNIVAVDDFNMGAMENKSLNIFNTSCVLAAPDITTDAGYQRVEAIVAHEYFHNYSGNRVTCRDWFQLSLKEGFTVFRDAEFSADMNSRGVKRVEDVTFLRTHQFAEDAGPMAHPVRPDSFIEISNFYTLTVYEKGAEVVRMLHTLLGHDDFIAGAQLYFKRHDGQAVTCDDFVTAMADASGRDLSQFRRWYAQSGTPELTIEEAYDAAQGRYTLTVRQRNGDYSEPLHIPLAVGLLENGQPKVFDNGSSTVLLEVTEAQQQFDFDNLSSRPVPSLLRGFSAPVRLKAEESSSHLQALIAGDDDDFVRWDAFQRYATQVLGQVAAGDTLDEGFFSAFGSALTAIKDPAVTAQLLALPSEEYLADLAAASGGVDVFAIRNAREQLKLAIAQRFEDRWRALFADLAITGPYEPSGPQIGARSLRHLALDYLAHLPDAAVADATALFASADNLTDRLAGLRTLVHYGHREARESALTQFFNDWHNEALVVNQWLSVQAGRPAAAACDEVAALMDHPSFDWRNPNKVRALLGAFSAGNPTGFHRTDGAGYRLLADAVIRLQASNPQIAARLCSPLTRYRRYQHGVELMRSELERIGNVEGLSRDVYEVVDRSLSQ